MKLVPLRDVKPYGKNPRKIPTKAIEQTAKSIRGFGRQQPIVTDAELVIIAGHTRRAAAERAGSAGRADRGGRAPDPEQARAYRIADNRDHDYSAWDYTALVEELAVWASSTPTCWTWPTGQRSGRLRGAGRPDPPDGAVMPGTGYSLTVEFGSREEADAAGPALPQIPGVLNVRHAHR